MSAVALVLLAVAKQVAVQLADVVLAERDRAVRVDDEIDGLGVARDLLLIARGESADADPAEKRLDLVISNVRGGRKPILFPFR